jgi:hypothetical protein
MITLPPIFFYVLGTLFVVFGVLRVIVLARRRADREVQEDTPQHVKQRRQHLLFGVVWIGVGLFFIASAAGLVGPRH